MLFLYFQPPCPLIWSPMKETKENRRRRAIGNTMVNMNLLKWNNKMDQLYSYLTKEHNYEMEPLFSCSLCVCVTVQGSRGALETLYLKWHRGSWQSGSVKGGPGSKWKRDSWKDHREKRVEFKSRATEKATPRRQQSRVERLKAQEYKRGGGEVEGVKSKIEYRGVREREIKG